MRSNIACTWPSGRVPLAASPASGVTRLLLLVRLQRGDVLDQLVELVGLLLPERLVGGHRGRGVHERARDRLLAEAVPYVGEVRPDRVAVVADLVAAEAA